MIVTCTCKNEYQDNLYGVGHRVHNKRGTKYPGKARCTVCGKENAYAKEDAKAEKPDAAK